MAVDSTTSAAVRAVDEAALSLYRRARTSGPDFDDVASVVKGLHTVLKHLRVEAEDPDSLLNTNRQGTSVYARQLTPIIEDCDFTLKQLATIFEKYGHHNGEGLGNGGEGADPSRERNMINLIRTKLLNQRTNLDIFLDTVQLHNPAKQRAQPPITSETHMEMIKDKVDVIAQRLYRRPNRGSDDEEDLWRQFCSELEREGFAGDVLRQNKEVIRAYLRGLDTHGLLDGNSPPPSVRGMLPSATQSGDPPAYPNPPPPGPAPVTGDTSPKEVVHPPFDNEKYAMSVKQDRALPTAGDLQQRQLAYVPQNQQNQMVAHAPPPAGLYNQDTGLSYDRYATSSSEDESMSSSSQQLALISTQELIALDKQEQDQLAARMGAMHLSPQPLLSAAYSPGTSPTNQRYLPAGKQAPQLLPAPVAGQRDLALSPRYVPPLPAYSALTPPPAYGSSPVVPPTLPSSFPGVGGHASQQLLQFSRLAPDSQGREIPLDAKWTKIKRSLVSTEVLARAGVRFEARPAFVAVLGVLTKADIAEFARQSAEVRRMRSPRGGARGSGRDRDRDRGQTRSSVQASHNGARYAGGRRRTGSTSPDSDSENVLWDESDTSEDERDYNRRYDRSRYIPKSAQQQRSKEGGDSNDDGDEKGHKIYPFIVSPPSDSKESAASPAATVKPKPILKNKNENHVRFDRDGPVEIPPDGVERTSPRGSRDEMDRDRRRERRTSNSNGNTANSSRRRDRERDRDRDRDRDRERDRVEYYAYGRSGGGSGGGRAHRREGQSSSNKKKAWGETLGAVGIGGAAASLLSVLTEAASGF